MAQKLTELEREEFICEIQENWSKWKKVTKSDELIKYMIDKAFTVKAEATLKAMTKEQLKEIILNGDEKPQEKQSTISKEFGTHTVEFLEDVKYDIHKEKFNPAVKKLAINQIDKNLYRIQDSDILDKLGFVGLIIAGVLVALEMLFKHGYKDIKELLKMFKEKGEAIAPPSS